jgi:hypothetical protein
MPQEGSQELLQASLLLLQWLGVPSLAGFLALYAAWLAFPPELVIEAVVDKSKKFNSESRIKIKNNGKLPALEIKADAENICARFGGITMKDCGIFNGPNAVGRLSGGESAEISVSPGMQLGQGMQITEFSYLLTLKHHTKLFFLRKEFKKMWKVELRNFDDGFAWHIVPV